MENYTQLTKEEKTQFWQGHFDSWSKSGISQKKYCAENSVSYWNFKTWYAKVKSGAEPLTRKFIKLQPDKIPNENAGKIEIKSGSKIVVCVEENISEVHLAKIFSALGYRHAQ